MNQDDAKVPNVDGDWQSMEIFLFSNGQQYSPPRKYLLRVDDLNLWDVTLNHLAQSHYGLQIPLIDLYTTNGQLVRGPLDLRDGQAYVAVVPPDTFVDAGYHKYLMKASKSWEKRQARKFPPECVLGEPCCLCPERQRSCCDPQACCLCPDREDSESQEQLLPASGHMDLGPPSGHFMSSAPAKSIAADDNEPVSSKTACATCGHVIRPGEIEYSPVQGPAKSDGYKARHDGNVVSPREYARLGENATRLCEYRPKVSEVAARLAEYGTGPREYETIPSVNVAKPGEYRDRPGENVARPAEYGVTKQGEYKTRLNGTRPGEFGVRPGEYETRPGEYGAKPDEYKSRTSVNGATASDFGTRPGDYGATLSKYETRPSVNGAKPYEYRAGLDEYEIRSTANGVKPGKYGARPLEYNTRPRVNEAKLGEFGRRPGEYETRPSVYQAKQAECGIKTDGYETRQRLNGAKPGEYETRPRLNGAKPGEYETRPSLNEAKPTEYETKPSLHEAKPGESETRPSLNGVKSGEYEARPSLNEAKPTEYETMQRLNGAKPGEYETIPSLNGAKLGEYETRPSLNGTQPGESATKTSLNGAKPDEYVARPSLNEAKPTEYDTRQRLNGAKLAEYETRPSLNGAKSGEYETRPSLNEAKLTEYETRPSLNGAKPGEYEARPSLNEAKPIEYETRQRLNGAKPGEYETRPSINGAKPGEYDTRQNFNGAKPAEYETRPSLNGAKPGEYETRPRLNGAKPGEYDTRPNLNGAKLAEYETGPSLNSANPSEYKTRTGLSAARAGEYDPKPNLNGARPGKYETKPYVKPGEYDGAIPGESGSRPDEYETRPNVTEAKLGEIGARPADYATQSSEQENKPDENGPSSVKKGAWSGENGYRTASHKTRPEHSGYRLGKIEPIKKAYEIVLHKNEKSLDESQDTPDKDTAEKDASIKSEFPRQSSILGPIGENGLEQKAEHRTREDDKRDKEIETKDRSSRNGRNGGECRVSSAEKNIRENDTVTGLVESRVRKNENARKLNKHSGAEIEQRSRTGEPTRGFDHGGRVSAQKDRETNPASRVSRQGARENGTRLGAQTNKQSDNLARLGGRESRVGDHEARAGDLGLGTSGHNAGLENPVTEPGAGAATSGSRASPKDRMSSRIKTNLVLPKIGTPGTRVNETLVRLNDADIKNKVDNLEARQSRVGSTETSGILHISGAQHHARRNKLSAGRPTIEKKRLSIEEKSTSLRKPTQNSNILRKTENKQPLKTNKENLLKKINEKASAIPVPASNDSGKSKTQCIIPAVPPPTTISSTELITSTTNKAPSENAIDEKEVTVVLTRSFKNPESEIESMRLDSVKYVLDTIENLPAETQTELLYIEKSMANVYVNEGVQTDTEAVGQHEKEVSASNKENTNSCTCVLCKQLHRRVDPDENDENTLSMLNKGGVVNIKLNIQVRNIVKSVYSCQKDCGRSQSLTNITRSEKESQISIDNDIVVNRTSLQSLYNKPNFQGFGFEGSPKVMVVQCAGCGRLNNPPRCDPSPCCDNNKKYFVLLENSVLEDMEDGCNFTPPRRPCDQRQSRKQSSGIPITQAFSETTLDTITTVTVSGVPLQRREMGKCVTNTSCQTEEPQSESVIAKRKVSITEDSVTKGDLQKKSSSSVCVMTQPDNLVLKQSCRKICSQKCEREDSQVCSDVCRVVCPPTTEKVEALFSSVRSPSCEIVEAYLQVRPPTCEIKAECSQVTSQACQVQSKGCQQANPQVQSQGCMPPSPTYTSFCLMLPPPPCTQAQTQVCPCQGPQVCNAETQTRWASILLQARLHCDGRYSFHLPPLYLLKNNSSYCQ